MENETKKCPYCAEDIKSAAILCKHCGRDLQAAQKNMRKQKTERKKANNLNTGFVILIIISFSIFIYYKYEQGLNAEVQLHQIDIHNAVIEDAIQQYGIAKRQGDKIQIAVQAGIVSAAYLQAHDEENYSKWKEIEKEDYKDATLTH